MIYRITGRQRCKWAVTNGNYPEMVICPDIFQNSPLTIRSNITTTLLHPTAPIVWLRRCTAQMVRQALSNFSRSTNPSVEKTRWASPPNCLRIHICVCFHAGFHFLESKCVDFFVRFCSVTLKCVLFLKFLSPARVSKTSLDCRICFLLDDKAKSSSFAVFVCFFYYYDQGCMKSRVFLFCIHICEKKQTRDHASLVFTSDEWDPEIVCVSVDGTAN